MPRESIRTRKSASWTLTYQALEHRQLLVAGADLALYEFTDHNSSSPDLASTDSHLQSSASEITSPLFLDSTGNGEPPRGLALGNPFDESSEPTPSGGQDDYFEFTITPAAGREIDFSKFSMQVRKNDPDSKNSFSIYFDNDPSSAGDNFSTRLLSATISSEDIFETLSVDLESVPQLAAQTTPVTFRVYTWGTVGLGSARLDNIRVQTTLAAVSDSEYVYYGESGRLIFPLDDQGNRVSDFSAAGFKNGSEPIPDVTQTIVASRIVNVSPVAGDDMATVQAAIDLVAAMSLDANGFRGIVQLSAGEFQISDQLQILDSGIVLRGVGDGENPATDTILRATGTEQRSLVVVGQDSGTASNAIPNTTHNIVDKYVPVGATSLNVDSTANWSVGDQIVVYRPSTTEWISALGTDAIPPRSDGGEVVQWTPGPTFDQFYERVITRIEDNRVFFDAPLMNSFEQQYGGGTVYRYNFSTPRINLVGIENIRGVSDFAFDTDEEHARTFIQLNGVEDAWVTNVTGQHFIYATVHAASRSLRVTVDDAVSLEPISVITGARRYAFTIDGQFILMQNLFSEDGRHDFVNNTPSRNRGPNVFLNGTAVNSNSSTGPHQRWSTGTLYDSIVTDNEIEARNRGNFGTGHGWAGANMVFWNSSASSYIAQNPPTAQNWVIGGGGLIVDDMRFGDQELANFDAHNSQIDFGRSDNPTNSLFIAQRNQANAELNFQEREYIVGDFDLSEFDGLATADQVYVDSLWQSEVAANAGSLAINLSDESETGQVIPFSFDYELSANEHVYAAVLSLGLRGTGGDTTDDSIWVESADNAITLSSLGLTNSLALDQTTVLTIEVLGTDLEMLADGIFNLALSGDSILDWANLEILAGQGVSQIVDSDAASNQVLENSNVGVSVGIVASAFDADASDAVSYQLVDDAQGRFAINNQTGVVTVAGPIDFESNVSHSIAVEVISSDGSSNIATFDIAVLNVDDAFVASRSIFYRGSSFDNAGTLDAVATDKSPLLNGSVSTFENYSSYSLGLNGVVLEVGDLNSVPTLPTVSDFFEFRVGNNDNPETWAEGPALIDLVFVERAGANDRVFLIWQDNAIQGEWLQTKVLANSVTGLLSEDTFYFGSAIGETGNSTSSATTNLADVALARLNQTGFALTTIDNVYDFNRDARVNLSDIAIARTNQSGFSALRLIDLTSSLSKRGNEGLSQSEPTSSLVADLSQFERSVFSAESDAKLKSPDEANSYISQSPPLNLSGSVEASSSETAAIDDSGASIRVSDGVNQNAIDASASLRDLLFEDHFSFVEL